MGLLLYQPILQLWLADNVTNKNFTPRPKDVLDEEDVDTLQAA